MTLRWILPIAMILGAALPVTGFNVYDFFNDIQSVSSPSKEGSTLCLPGGGEHRALSINGAAPSWFHWYEPLVSEDEADVIVTFNGAPKVHIELFGQHEEANVNEVNTCLWEIIYDERLLRLEHLGITEKPHHVAHGRSFKNTRPAQNPLDKPTTGALAIVFILLAGAGGWAADALPTNRRSGWLENLYTLPVSKGAVLVSWCGACGFVVISSMLAFLVPYLLFGGVLTLPMFVALVALAALMVIVSLRIILRAPDIRSAGMASMVLMAIPTVLGTVAWIMATMFGPIWGAAVPLGGLVLAGLGVLEPWPVLLAIITTIPLAVLIWRNCLQMLNEELATGGFSQTELRRSNGNYLPEAILLFIFAAVGSVEIMGLNGQSPTSGLIMSQLLCFALPALLVGRLLSLPTHSLLRLSIPHARAWALMPFLIAGSLSTAILTSMGQYELLDWGPEVLDQYTQQMEQIWAGGGLLAVALLPGLCEELLFRGAILGLLSRRGGWVMAVLLQALLFGLVHIFAFKLLPTAAFGLLLGILAVRCGSVWPGVVVHLVHNATLFLLGKHLTDAPDGPLLLGMGVASVAGFGAAWWSGSGRVAQPDPLTTPRESRQSRSAPDEGA